LQPPTLAVAAVLEKTDRAILVKLFLENNGMVNPEAVMEATIPPVNLVMVNLDLSENSALTCCVVVTLQIWRIHDHESNLFILDSLVPFFC
jgi:hypothetical protein